VLEWVSGTVRNLLLRLVFAVHKWLFRTELAQFITFQMSGGSVPVPQKAVSCGDRTALIVPWKSPLISPNYRYSPRLSI
jgi:hypothetical protein